MSQTLIISFSISFVARVTCLRLVIVKRSCLPPVLSFYKAWDFLNSIFIPDLGRTDISTSLISRKILFLIAIFPFSFRFRAAGIKCSKNVRTCERNSSKQSRKKSGLVQELRKRGRGNAQQCEEQRCILSGNAPVDSARRWRQKLRASRGKSQKKKSLFDI